MIQSKDRSQINIIHTLRGLAALAVCLYHFVATTTGYFKSEIVLRIFEAGRLGVPLFFVISGVVIPLSMIDGNYQYKSWGKFLLKRITRIEPPYIVSVVISLLYVYIRTVIPGSAPIDLTPTWRDLFLHVGYLVAFFEGAKWLNPAYWTLAVEFQYYIFLSLLFPLVLQGNKWLRWLFYLICLVLPFIPMMQGFSHKVLHLFLLGILFALLYRKIISQLEYILVTCITALAMLHICQWGYYNVAILTVIILILIPNKEFKIGNWLGKISYSLYLIHPVTGGIVINFLSHRFTAPYQKPLVVLLGLAIAIGSAYLMYYFVEKPSQALSKKIKY